MPEDPSDNQAGAARPRVAPPVFTPPRLVTPDTVLRPGEAVSPDSDVAHPGTEVRGILTPKMMTSEPVYDDEDDLDDAGVSSVPTQNGQVPQQAAQPVSQPGAQADPQSLPTTGSPSAMPPGADAPTVGTATPPAKQRPNYKLVALYAAIVIVAVGVILFVLTKARGAQGQVASRFVEYIQHGNAEKAYGLTSSRFRDVTSKDSFEQYAGQESQLLPKTEARVVDTVSEQAGSTPTTSVALDIKGGDAGSDYHAVIQLVKEDGEWLVYSADIKSGPYSEPLSTSR